MPALDRAETVAGRMLKLISSLDGSSRETARKLCLTAGRCASDASSPMCYLAVSFSLLSLSLQVFMYVWTYIDVYVWVYKGMYARMYACMYAYEYSHTYIYT